MGGGKDEREWDAVNGRWAFRRSLFSGSLRGLEWDWGER